MRRRNFSASLTLFAILPSSVFAETGDETKFDLIIIGIGAAGLSTAVSAAQNGVKNILSSTKRLLSADIPHFPGDPSTP